MIKARATKQNKREIGIRHLSDECCVGNSNWSAK